MILSDYSTKFHVSDTAGKAWAPTANYQDSGAKKLVFSRYVREQAAIVR